MRIRGLLICIAVFPALSATAASQSLTCEQAISSADQLVEMKEFESAIEILNLACSDEAATPASRLKTARILSWAGRYDEAEQIFNGLLAEQSENLDVLVARGNMYYYKGELRKAEVDFTSVLERAPEYGDARDGLQRARNAIKAKDETLGPVLRIDTNYSETRVDGPQQDWSEFTARAAYRHKEYSYSAQVSQLDRFGLNDTEVTVGVERVAREGTNVSAHVSFTPDADFRADVGVGAGVSHTFDPKWGPVMQLGLNYDYDKFDESDVHTIAPNLTAYFQNGLVLSGRVVNVAQDSEFTTGWSAQAYMPLGERFAARLGYAQAPEVIDGLALDTQSFFGGVSVKLVDGVELSFNYSNDDRDGAFDREGFNIGLTFRR